MRALILVVALAACSPSVPLSGTAKGEAAAEPKPPPAKVVPLAGTATATGKAR